MKTDSPNYREIVALLNEVVPDTFLPASPKFVSWLSCAKLPVELIELFAEASPHSEAWLGAGAFFDEDGIIESNVFHHDALAADLFIIGSAGNGDHIAVDTRTGSVGYLCHEADWVRDGARRWFVPVSESLGQFAANINRPDNGMPDDYWEAVRKDV